MRSIRVKGGVPVFFFPMTLELLEVREKCHFPYSSKTMGYINRKRRLFRCKAPNNKAEASPTRDRQQASARAEQHIAAEAAAPHGSTHTPQTSASYLAALHARHTNTKLWQNNYS